VTVNTATGFRSSAKASQATGQTDPSSGHILPSKLGRMAASGIEQLAGRAEIGVGVRLIKKVCLGINLVAPAGLSLGLG